MAEYIVRVIPEYGKPGFDLGPYSQLEEAKAVADLEFRGAAGAYVHDGTNVVYECQEEEEE